MRNGRKNKALRVLRALLWLCGAGWGCGACGAEAGLPLPPLAVVKSEDSTGKTWRQTGKLRGTVEHAGREFRQALACGGWKVEKMIASGRLAARSQLMVCCRRRQRVLLMVWEEEVGTCGFAWGRET